MARRFLIIATLLVATCGGTQPVPASPAIVLPPQSTAPSRSAAPSSSVAPSATPTQDEVRATAANAYRRAVIPLNRTVKALFKKYGNATSLKSLKTFCSKLDVVTRSWIKALQAITWPTDTAADAKTLIRAEASADANLRGCAKATGSSSWYASWDLYVKFNNRSIEAANLVRLDLGLNPVPG